MSKIRCSQCEHTFEELEPYTVIDGDIYCKDCADEWIKDELAESFDKYREKIMEMIGLPALEVVYG